MRNWYHIIPRNTGLSSYAWIIFCILPFYFIFHSSTTIEIIIGITMIILFFATYRLSFLSEGWSVYLSVGIEMTISIVMTLFFGYVYFSLFLAFYIGNLQNKVGFITLYVVHLVTTLAAVSIGFISQSEAFLMQIPFIIISVIGVILLPFTLYNRNKQEKLESQLKEANKRISQLVVMEERHRIARDLHDTLGQKLSLIGLKSDLARKLVSIKPDAAKNEINDIHQTARTALKEVREMVSEMKGTKLKDELIRVQQILDAAQIECKIDGDLALKNVPLLIENVLSMSMKEAVTNVVKHSGATFCKIIIKQIPTELTITVMDNGIGIPDEIDSYKRNGLQGMRERLEFVNGHLELVSGEGTTLTIHVPHVIKQETK
ncbi:sensor histidine kinase [Virgibacillus phasianinus]|uniref:histidine kinase n=1 Tax=Virgibacillus phasianinus TaxID=2017483 RepID=A0A220U1X1_9BACI|nr:sensor histidine kinase [Virgibacillus phasianinus]ASK61926.1 sensor histidine kinase [Virgibacillus phasianinus]